uniref:Uncharacterized protein n=1 Tax=Anopheles culicifacies TaxID=139723 RepID=A0A182LZD0_9DIPT
MAHHQYQPQQQQQQQFQYQPISDYPTLDYGHPIISAIEPYWPQYQYSESQTTQNDSLSNSRTRNNRHYSRYEQYQQHGTRNTYATSLTGLLSLVACTVSFSSDASAGHINS